MSDSSNKTNFDKTIIITEKSDLNSRPQTNEPYLIQLSGRETGKAQKLAGQTVRIGRDPACQIIVDDPHVSRIHAEITTNEKKEISIKDAGSTNGVYVNGKRITGSVILSEGDKILIGTRLYFKFCYQDNHEHEYQQNLFRAANIDALTQLYNKKYFIESLNKEFSFSRRDKQPLSLMMVDIDHFKKINDTYGHLAGDEVLRVVGGFLLKDLRLENVACRYGGEEFAVILRNVNSDLAHTVAERLRMQLEQTVVAFRDKEIQITVSIGIATLQNHNFQSVDDFIQKADEFLYEAKTHGRNRTVTTTKRAA